jgi:hypothetical protein
MRPLVFCTDLYTSEDWYGHSPASVAFIAGREPDEVHVMLTRTHNGGWSVWVWGSDDCHMENDFRGRGKAWECYQDVVGLADVTRDALKLRGFMMNRMEIK